jgi:hypothetical protein
MKFGRPFGFGPWRKKLKAAALHAVGSFLTHDNVLYHA